MEEIFEVEGDSKSSPPKPIIIPSSSFEPVLSTNEIVPSESLIEQKSYSKVGFLLIVFALILILVSMNSTWLVTNLEYDEEGDELFGVTGYVSVNGVMFERCSDYGSEYCKTYDEESFETIYQSCYEDYWDQSGGDTWWIDIHCDVWYETKLGGNIASIFLIIASIMLLSVIILKLKRAEESPPKKLNIVPIYAGILILLSIIIWYSLLWYQLKSSAHFAPGIFIPILASLFGIVGGIIENQSLNFKYKF